MGTRRGVCNIKRSVPRSTSSLCCTLLFVRHFTVICCGAQAGFFFFFPFGINLYLGILPSEAVLLYNN